MPVPRTGADEVRGAVEDILARPELRDSRTLLERARDWAFDRIAEVLEALAGSQGRGLFGWAVVVALAVGAVVFAVRFSVGLRRDPTMAADRPSSTHRPAVDWRGDADAHEVAGEWRAALRCRWRALVADLAGRGLVEEVPGRTAGEYRRALTVAAPGRADDFDGATSLFEAAWYGNRPTSAAESARFQELADRVLAGTGGAA